MRTLIIYFLLLLFLSGCVQKEILDDISMEIGRGYDKSDGNYILGTSLLYNFQPDKSIENTTLTSKAKTSRELINQLQKQASDPLAEGNLEVILFSKKLAAEGILDLLDAPQRNASIGARIYIAIVEGSSKDLLAGEYGNRGNAIYISNLIKNTIKTEDVPKTNLHLFFRDYYQEGKTGYLPQLKKISHTKLKINGISLFKDDQVIHTIKPDKMFYFKLLVDKFSDGAANIKDGNNEGIIRSITSKHRLELTDKSPFEVTVHLKIKGVIREYTGKKLNKSEIQKLEKNLEKKTSKECLALVEGFQKQGIDPVGFGYFIKTKTRGFDFNKWEEQYPSLKVKINTDVEILEYGVIE